MGARMIAQEILAPIRVAPARWAYFEETVSLWFLISPRHFAILDRMLAGGVYGGDSDLLRIEWIQECDLRSLPRGYIPREWIDQIK